MLTLTDFFVCDTLVLKMKQIIRYYSLLQIIFFILTLIYDSKNCRLHVGGIQYGIITDEDIWCIDNDNNLHLMI